MYFLTRRVAPNGHNTLKTCGYLHKHSRPHANCTRVGTAHGRMPVETFLAKLSSHWKEATVRGNRQSVGRRRRPKPPALMQRVPEGQSSVEPRSECAVAPNQRRAFVEPYSGFRYRGRHQDAPILAT